MSFSTMIKTADRERLRRIVRKVHLQFLPQHMITNYECDKLIDSFSEEVIENQLRSFRAAGHD